MHQIALDVTDQSSIDHAVHQVHTATEGHGLDVLVNAAGTMVLGPVEAVPDELVEGQFHVNVFGLVAVTRAFLPQMRDRRAGRIVNVSSAMGRFALPGSGWYSASKFAVEAISDALRMELAPFGVRVVLVEPGVIDTPLYESAAVPFPVLVRPRAVLGPELAPPHDLRADARPQLALTGSDNALGLVGFSLFPHLEREDMPDTSSPTSKHGPPGYRCRRTRSTMTPQ